MMFYNKTLLDAKSKIEKQFRQDKEKYEIDKQKFYANPIHWDNNKRKRAGLHTLRRTCNNDGNKKFRCFRTSQDLFKIFDDVIDKYLLDKFNENWFDNFVEVRNLNHNDMEGEYLYEASSIF